MVLEANKQFHAVNKCIVAHINKTSILTDDQKKALIDEWKKTTGSKLKSTMVKTSKPKVAKRVVSKYIYFCTDERPRILRENPDMNINECTRMMGSLWQEFLLNPDPERMEKYTKLFEADQIRYEKEKLALEEAAAAAADTTTTSPRRNMNRLI